MKYLNSILLVLLVASGVYARTLVPDYSVSITTNAGWQLLTTETNLQEVVTTFDTNLGTIVIGVLNVSNRVVDAENNFGLINTNTYLSTNLFDIIGRMMGLSGTMHNNYSNWYTSFQEMDNGTDTNTLADLSTFTNIHYSINTNIDNLYDLLATNDIYIQNNVLLLHNDTNEFTSGSPWVDPGTTGVWQHIPAAYIVPDGATNWYSTPSGTGGLSVITMPLTAVYRISIWNWWIGDQVRWGFSRDWESGDLDAVEPLWELASGAQVTNLQADSISLVGTLNAGTEFGFAIRRETSMTWNDFYITIELLGPVGEYGVNEM